MVARNPLAAKDGQVESGIHLSRDNRATLDNLCIPNPSKNPNNLSIPSFHNPRRKPKQAG